MKNLLFESWTNKKAYTHPISKTFVYFPVALWSHIQNRFKTLKYFPCALPH